MSEVLVGGSLRRTRSLPAAQPAAMFNNSGVTNLAAFAFGLDPKSPNPAGLPGMTIENGYLTITATRSPSATDVTLTPQVSGDLRTWGSSATDTTVLVNQPTLFKARDNIPMASATRRFIRLQISRP